MGFFKRLLGIEHKVRPEALAHYNMPIPSESDGVLTVDPDKPVLKATTVATIKSPTIPTSPANPLKRGRGRPRKDSVAAAPVKRGRGRPRKDETVAPVARAAAKKPKKGKMGGKKGGKKKGY